MTFSLSHLLSTHTDMDINNHNQTQSQTQLEKAATDSPSSNWGLEIPKFKSHTPSSIPFSPSAYLALAADLLDSPAVFSTNSNILPSSTTGGFSFQPDTRPGTASSSTSVFQFSQNKVSMEDAWNSEKMVLKSESEAVSGLSSGMGSNQVNMEADNVAPVLPTYYTHYGKEQKSEDGYNWRKYGQKQMKGSENPRSYYKCTFPSCPTKKKVERSLDGHITEIVYKGTHNHAKPLSTRRNSSHLVSNPSAGKTLGNAESATMQDASSFSVGDDDFNKNTSMSNSVGDDGDDDNEPDTKRWKGDNEYESAPAGGNRTVREPRIVVQTTSDIDILDDGYRWRKYGQKVVKGNHNPRSYYKCTYVGCSVRKLVERASHDMRAVITTYEGKHNHDVPAPRGSGYNVPIAAVKPSVTTSYSNHTTKYPNPLQSNTRYQQTASGTAQAPFTLEMLQRPAGDFDYSYLNQVAQQSGGRFQLPKEEVKEDSFLESLTSWE